MKRISRPLLIDMDGVLADFDEHFCNVWQERFPGLPQLPRTSREVYMLDDNLDRLGGYGSMGRSIIKEKGFFANIPPQPGALSAINRIKALINAGKFPFSDFFICTSPLTTWEHCVGEKFDWVERWLGHDLTKKIIFCKKKNMINGSYLLDDDPDRRDRAGATWKQILFETPYSLHWQLPAVTWNTFFHLSIFEGNKGLDIRKFCIS